VPITRRQFLWSAAASAGSLHGSGLRDAGVWPDLLYAQSSDRAAFGVFRHGVASGDPLTDRVILWTRVTSADPRSTTPIEVRWRIGDDPAVTRPIAQGTMHATIGRDFTVKVDAGGLEPGRPYHYVFESGGDRSPIGRTRTLPSGDVDRVRLASVCCANYPTGFFNVYRCVANRADIDAVVHLRKAGGSFGSQSLDARRSRSATTGYATPPTVPTWIFRKPIGSTRSSRCGTTTR
jgi:alkaline phosphatase D